MAETKQGRCVAHGATLRGVEAIAVDVEVSVSAGMPSFNIVGMADASIQEARERIRAAFRACGFQLPVAKIVVNLAPGSVRKTGTGFDLPIALGVLAATGQVDPRFARECLAVGELSLEGVIRPVPGLLAYALTAKTSGLKLMSARPGQSFPPIEGLVHVESETLSSFRAPDLPLVPRHPLGSAGQKLDFGDVSGHDAAKRVMQIAAAGGHGVLMVGPPGSGKTMLASRLPSILPPLSQDEIIQTAVIHSVASEPLDSVLAGARPFRSPHHSATLAGLVGGGSPLRPGEVTLAHNGVLFLDELPEFKPSVLQAIRQPMESGNVCLTRADGNVLFPARFALVAAANPCPCGFYGDPDHPCKCTLAQVMKYQSRVGGPIMDRIDLHLEVRRLPSSEILRSRRGTDSSTLLEGVLAAREYASWRRAKSDFSSISGKMERLMEECALGDNEQTFLERAAATHALSGRAIARILNVSRTIADMDQQPSVGMGHLAEAFGYRVAEKGA